jgi:Domain of unknown function (DUF4160)
VKSKCTRRFREHRDATFFFAFARFVSRLRSGPQLKSAAVPTVLREGGYRFFFYADDRNEPRHIHVQREDRTAKFWLEPIVCERNGGFNRSDLMGIYRLIARNRELLLQKWYDFFGD